MCILPQVKWNLQSLQQLSWDNEVGAHPSYPHLHLSTPPRFTQCHAHTARVPPDEAASSSLFGSCCAGGECQFAGVQGGKSHSIPGKIDLSSRELSVKMLSAISVQVWWGMRCCFIQQRLLEQRSATLWDKISKQMGEHQLLELTVTMVACFHGDMLPW